MRRIAIVLCGLLAMAAISRVTLELAHGRAALTQGDAKRGAQIAAEGTEAGAPACVSCHAVAGNPDGSGSFPRLFGLPRDYLVKQLRDYAAGQRKDDVMSTVAQSLKDPEMLDVAAYYATAQEPFPAFPPSDRGLIILGEKLATIGDGTKEMPGCNNCHGPAGIGQPPRIPYLAGQFAAYMTEQLQRWQNGQRTNDSGAQMSVLTKRMTAHDMAAASAYFQQARPAAGAAPLPPNTVK